MLLLWGCRGVWCGVVLGAVQRGRRLAGRVPRCVFLLALLAALSRGLAAIGSLFDCPAGDQSGRSLRVLEWVLLLGGLG